MKKTVLSFLIVLIAVAANAQDFSKFVDPFIGTGGHGHTFPGATVPFGMMQLSPDTRIDGSWDGCSGYHSSDSVIYGFTHTHLSGTGCSDYGDILLMPMAGTPSTENKVYSSGFSHKNEKAEAGFYSVVLNDGNILAELTTTTRAGIHKYSFPQGEIPSVVIDLTHRDITLASQLKIVSRTRIEGMRRSQAWASDQHIYFVAEFSRPFTRCGALNTSSYQEPFELNGKDIKTWFTFDKNKEPLLVRVGISTVSIDGARKNLETELNHWDFEKVRKAAREEWNKELSKISVKSAQSDKLKIFYTALYHTMTQPNVNMDVDGAYRGRDNKIHRAEGFTYYSVFSLWDTFRAAHPLYTIIDRKRTLDFIKTFLAQYKDGGRLPVWELASNETDCMIGYHSVSVITDAFMKEIKDFDSELAFKAMKASATWNHLGLPQYMDHGYLSMEDEHENVSKTLEYAYDDWCIAQFAGQLNKSGEKQYFLKRSEGWRSLFDKETGFMRPRKNGGWLTPFEPREVNNNFTEANSWQYTFFVPHNINGMIGAYGSYGAFEKKLSEMFTAPAMTLGRDQADITGLIGQYAHGNEPSHHIAYLFNYAGRPDLAQNYLHKILNEFYTTREDGLIGNEDCGQMSAWYVLSAMGFYQVCPGNPHFSLGTPEFEAIDIHLENGKIFKIRASELSHKNYFVKSAMLDGKEITYPFAFSYNDILNGKTLQYNMSAHADGKSKISSAENIFNNSAVAGFLCVPVIQAGSRVFRDSMLVSMKAGEKDVDIYYTLDGSEPGLQSNKYNRPFYIKENCTVKAKSVLSGKTELSSPCAVATYFKYPNNWKIKINSVYNAQYTAGGDEGIMDGIRGELNWRKGEWQGYQSDFEAIIDMGSANEIKKLSAGFLQDTRAWIVMPAKVEFAVSEDGKQFKTVAILNNTIAADDYTVQLKEFSQSMPAIKARYVKVNAFNYGKLPSWHQGVGGQAYIFIDEIMIE